MFSPVLNLSHVFLFQLKVGISLNLQNKLIGNSNVVTQEMSETILALGLNLTYFQIISCRVSIVYNFI